MDFDVCMGTGEKVVDFALLGFASLFKISWCFLCHQAVPNAPCLPRQEDGQLRLRKENALLKESSKKF